ncbi:hypothetical protein EDB85DRAFT_2145708 [Lactarius pseudohatsudake]|nr:hypothetical protein EDB85DRAFT_2145708 [Lactarius pseudohatsudake]
MRSPSSPFLNILIEYFREVTTPVLRDSFNIVHKLLEETIDAGGHSLTTALNALRDIVLPSLPHPASPPNGTIITSSVLGKVDVNCKLSGAPFLASIPLRVLHSTNTRAGTPDLLLTLTYSHTISGPSFHPCVRFTKPLCAIKHSLSSGRTADSRSWNTSSAPRQANMAQRQLSQPLPQRSSKYKYRSRCVRRSPSPTTAFTSLEDVAVDSGATGATCSGGEWVYVPAQRWSPWFPRARQCCS